MPNRFTVTPAKADISPVLSGLGVLAERNREEAKRKESEEALMAAYQGRDPDAVASLIAKNPELGGSLSQMIGHRNKITEQNYADTVRQAITNPEKIPELIQARAEMVRAQGGDPAETEMALQEYQQDPEGFKKNLELEYARLATKQEWEAYKGQTGQMDTDQVHSAEIMDSGVVQYLTKGGKVKVIEPTDDEKGVIKRAEERGINIQQQRAQGRGLGKDASKIAGKAFEKTGRLRINNSKLKRVISEAKSGAGTGPIEKSIKSFKTASIRLDQIRQELGLDVVGSVTFGALSEGELQLALDTALPTGLQGPELIKWAEEKITAQEKLATYLEDQAIFLSEKGNTAAHWIQKVRSDKKQGPLPPVNAQGWKLMVDAQGNKAYVGPGGEIEEAK